MGSFINDVMHVEGPCSKTAILHDRGKGGSQCQYYCHFCDRGSIKGQMCVTSFMNDQKILSLSARAPKMILMGQETEEMVKK